jgi:hypothetical protein
MSKSTQQKRRCSALVKQVFQKHHSNACCTSRDGVVQTGTFLNQYCNDKFFVDENEYNLCRNLNHSFDKGSIKKIIPPTPQPPPPLTVPPITVTPSGQRQTRQFMRDYNKNVFSINELENNNKSLHIIIDSLKDELQEVRNQLRQYRDEYEAIVEEVTGVEAQAEESNNTVVDEPVRKKCKVSTYTLHHQRLVMKMQTEFKNRKISFDKLKERQKKDRIDDIVINIIATCIDRIAMKKNENYYVGDEDVANSVGNVLNRVHNELEKRLKRVISETPQPLRSDEEMDGDKRGEDSFQQQSSVELALKILQECTARGYERIRKCILEHIGEIGSKFNLELPSCWKLMNELPLQVEAVSVEIPLTSEEVQKSKDIIMGTTKGQSIIKKEGFDAFAFFEKTSNALGSSATNTLKVIGAKIKGSYVDYCNIMLDKLNKQAGPIGAEDQILFLNVIDGAEAFRSNKTSGTIISHNTSILSPTAINNGTQKPHESQWCLTHLQHTGKESTPIMKEMTSEYLKIRATVQQREVTLKYLSQSNEVWVYDMHDAKLLYVLLSCSHYKRKHHRFLGCKCKNGEGVMGCTVDLKGKVLNQSHICEKISDDEYRVLFALSYQKLQQEQWTDAEHKKWCDEYNFGVTHFGIDAELIDLSSIRFDTFHMMCSIVKQVMGVTRLFMIGQPPEIKEEFTNDVLGTFWSDHLLMIWNNKMSF